MLMSRENSVLGSFETTFVLFFLSLDLGQNLLWASFDTAFLALTVLAVAVLPYFLRNDDDAGFGSWMVGKLAVISFALLMGIGFGQLVGVLVPTFLSALPLALAVIAAVISCVMMYRNVVFVRYAD